MAWSQTSRRRKQGCGPDGRGCGGSVPAEPKYCRVQAAAYCTAHAVVTGKRWDGHGGERRWRRGQRIHAVHVGVLQVQTRPKDMNSGVVEERGKKKKKATRGRNIKELIWSLLLIQ